MLDNDIFFKGGIFVKKISNILYLVVLTFLLVVPVSGLNVGYLVNGQSYNGSYGRFEAMVISGNPYWGKTYGTHYGVTYSIITVKTTNISTGASETKSLSVSSKTVASVKGRQTDGFTHYFTEGLFN